MVACPERCSTSGLLGFCFGCLGGGIRGRPSVSCRVSRAQNNKSPNGLWYRVPQIPVNDTCLFQIGEQRLRLKAGG
jgi:hypothetical protein